MLTAKDGEVDKFRGLTHGVDDYITKPFSFAELVARAQVVIRRTSESQNTNKARRIVNGALVIDIDAHRITKAGHPIELTPTEFRLLQTLSENARARFTHEQLLESVWGYDAGEDTGYVKRYVWYLRHKLEDDPSNPQYILTERGFGYSFSAN